MKIINFLIIFSLFIFLGCSQGFFGIANKETFIVETLSMPVPLKESGNYCPFNLSFSKTDDNSKIFYKIDNKEVNDFKIIDNEYTTPIKIESDCIVSVIKKKDNLISKILKLNYKIFKRNITSPIPLKVDGKYLPFIFSFIEEKDYSIKYKISDRLIEEYDEIDQIYTGEIAINQSCFVNGYRVIGEEISPILNVRYEIYGDELISPVASKTGGTYPAFMLSLSGDENGGVIKYVISDKEITEYDSINIDYSSPILIKDDCVISTYLKLGEKISKIISYKYVIDKTKLSIPIPSKTSGNYLPFDLGLTSSLGVVYYELSTIPLTNFTQITKTYTDKIKIENDIIVSAYVKNGNDYSLIINLDYKIYKRNISTPIPSKLSGTYTPFKLMFTTETGYEIKYKITDNIETYYENIDQIYTGEIAINQSCYVNGYRVKGDEISPILNMKYEIYGDELISPVASKTGGTYPAFMLSLSGNENGGVIKYVISDKEIAEYDSINTDYSSPILIKDDCVISTYLKLGEKISKIISYKYVIDKSKLSIPIPSKTSGNYLPFDLGLTSSLGVVYYELSTIPLTNFTQITKTYTDKIKIENDIIVSAYVKNGNDYSEVINLNYSIMKNRLATPISNKLSGTYNQFLLKFVDENDGSQIMYRKSNESTDKYDLITTLYDKSSSVLINNDTIINAYKIKNSEISAIIKLDYKITGAINSPAPDRLTGEYFPFSLSFENTDDSKIFYIATDSQKTKYEDINTEYKTPVPISNSCIVSYYKIKDDFVSTIGSQNYQIISATPDAAQIINPAGTNGILRWDELFYNKITWSNTISSGDLKYHILFDFNSDGSFEYSINNSNSPERLLTEDDMKNLGYNDCQLSLRVDIKDNYGILLKEGISKQYKYTHKLKSLKDFNLDLIDVENNNNNFFVSYAGKDINGDINLGFMLLDYKHTVLFDKKKTTILKSDILSLSTCYGSDKGAFVLNVDDNGINKVFTLFDINTNNPLGDIGSGFEGRTAFIKYYNNKFYLVYIDKTNKLILNIYNLDGALSSTKILKDDFSLSDSIISFENKGNYFMISVEYLNLGITKIKSYIYNLDFSSYVLYNCDNSVNMESPTTAINLNKAGVLWVENNIDYYYKLALVPEGTVGNKVFIDIGSGKKPDICENNNEFLFVYSKNYYGKEELYYGTIDQNGLVTIPKRVTSDYKTRNSLRIIGNDKKYLFWIEDNINIGISRIF